MEPRRHRRGDDFEIHVVFGHSCIASMEPRRHRRGDVIIIHSCAYL